MRFAHLLPTALLSCLALPSTLALQFPQFTNQAPLVAALDAPTHQIHTSSRHPKHKWHIKAHPAGAWCDPKARSWTGYIDSGYGKELFFWYFESRSAPKEDPVVMWINGGPGGSSAMGLLMEQGPCRIKHDPKSINDTYPNPYAWNENANVFFLDQPIGVGYSHAKHGQTVSTTEEAAVDVAAFIEIFFEVFDDLKGRPFHMSGESYAGRYLPLFAGAVYDNNAKLIKDGLEPVNLQSVLIGNGLTSTFAAVDATYDLLCTKHIDLGTALMSVRDCANLVPQLNKCRSELQKHCIDTSDYASCSVWLDHCTPFWDDTPLMLGLNRYNLNQTCTPEESEKYLCMKDSLDMKQYLHLPEVIQFLGAQVDFDKNNQVDEAFIKALDWSHQTYYYVANLLERGIKVLNYVGTLDAACCHFAQERWMAEMPWTGRDGYNAAEWKSWKVNGKEAGVVKKYENLTLHKVFGAGHLVPTDQPEAALALLNEWIHN